MICRVVCAERKPKFVWTVLLYDSSFVCLFFNFPFRFFIFMGFAKKSKHGLALSVNLVILHSLLFRDQFRFHMQQIKCRNFRIWHEFSRWGQNFLLKNKCSVK